MEPALIGAIMLLGSLGAAVFQHRRRRAHNRQAIGEIVADASGFTYTRNHAVVRRVGWQEIAEVRLERKQVTDWWEDDSPSWSEEYWVLAFHDDTLPLTIPGLLPVREQWIAAATCYLPGFRADCGVLADSGKPGSAIVYPAPDARSRVAAER